MKTTLYVLSLSLTLILNGYSETFKLWSEGEGGEGAENVTLTIHRAKTETKEEKTSAIIICPGGGYGMCVMSYEGNDVGKWFAQRGITAFVL